MKKLYELLDIRPGVTAIIGSGGKTILMYQLAGELWRAGKTVLLTTSTHIIKPEQFGFSDTAEGVKAILAEKQMACTGTLCGDGKLTAPSYAGWETLAEYVLVEADGSKRLPLKAHEAHEPVIPQSANNTICVVGFGGFDQVMAGVVHRREKFTELTGCGEYEKVTPEHVAAVIEKEDLCDRIYLNQLDLAKGFSGQSLVKEFVKAVKRPVVGGSLREQNWKELKK